MSMPPWFKARMLDRDLPKDLIEQRQVRKLLDPEHLGAQAIVDIVGVVGDVVGDGATLRLGARIAPKLEVMALRIIRDRERQAAGAIALHRPSGAVDQRAVVL